jgi:phage baseplate assembly protein W
MAQTFIGFNTQGQFKKFTLTDSNLIKRDLLNALNIRQGSLPGKPEYGTVIWDFLFEAQLEPLEKAIENEIQRMIATDPRLVITDIQVFPQDNGILLQLELAIQPSSESEVLNLFLNPEQRSASFV